MSAQVIHVEVEEVVVRILLMDIVATVVQVLLDLSALLLTRMYVDQYDAILLVEYVHGFIRMITGVIVK